MNYTIDLLKDSERRYEGPVSTRFLLYAGLGAGLAVLVLVGAYFVFLGLLLRVHLDRVEQTWAQVEPRYEVLASLQDSLRQAERTAEELDGWRRSGESWHRILLHLQRQMPDSIQVVRLEARDVVEPPPRPQGGGAIEDPVRRAQIYLTGRVVGPAGEEVVTRLIRSLLEPADDRAPVFRTASLVSMQRDRREADRIVNLFDLDMAGYPRDVK